LLFNRDYSTWNSLQRGPRGSLRLHRIFRFGRVDNNRPIVPWPVQAQTEKKRVVRETYPPGQYQLYHHAFFVADDGKWAVVQQGMCAQDRTARRYHWSSENLNSYVVEPHSAIVGDARRESALDMTSKESQSCREASVDIAKEPTEKIMRMISPAGQKMLDEWFQSSASRLEKKDSVAFLSMPINMNWKAMRDAYEFQPKNYEELLAIRGIGPNAVRGLALIAELMYGAKPSWKDPVKYSFAYGGKDGVPFPVDRKAMDESIQMLKQTVEAARIGDKEKMLSLQRLRKFVPPDI
jgi:hypothetical protein